MYTRKVMPGYNPVSNSNSHYDYLARKYALRWREITVQRNSRSKGKRHIISRQIHLSKDVIPLIRPMITILYEFGLHPFQWNSRQNLFIIPLSGWSLWRWKFTSWITLTTVSMMAVSMLMRLFKTGSHLNSWHDMFHSILFIIFVTAELSHFNIATRGGVALTFINGVLKYYQRIENYLYQRRPNGFGTLDGSLLKNPFLYLAGGYVAPFIVIWVGILFYLFACEFHCLFLIVPSVCKYDVRNDEWSHGWDALVPALSVLQFILIGHIIGSLAMTAIAIIIYVFMGNYLLEGISELSKTNLLIAESRFNDNTAVNMSNSWSLSYRTWQIMHCLFNDFIGEFMAPALVACLVVQAITVTFSIISMLTSRNITYSSLFLLFLLAVLLTDLILLSIFATNAVRFTELSTRWLESKQRHLIKRNKFNIAFIRSSRKLEIKLGIFGYLKRSTILTILFFVIDRSITLLIWHQ